MASTTASSTTESITNTISDAANYVKESLTGSSAEAKKEANKCVSFRPVIDAVSLSILTTSSLLHAFREVAKGNTDASLGDRVSAGFSAVGNKADESSANAKADAHKESMKRTCRSASWFLSRTKLILSPFAD